MFLAIIYLSGFLLQLIYLRILQDPQSSTNQFTANACGMIWMLTEHSKATESEVLLNRLSNNLECTQASSIGDSIGIWEDIDAEVLFPSTHTIWILYRICTNWKCSSFPTLPPNLIQDFQQGQKWRKSEEESKFRKESWKKMNRNVSFPAPWIHYAKYFFLKKCILLRLKMTPTWGKEHKGQPFWIEIVLFPHRNLKETLYCPENNTVCNYRSNLAVTVFIIIGI